MCEWTNKQLKKEETRTLNEKNSQDDPGPGVGVILKDFHDRLTSLDNNSGIPKNRQTWMLICRQQGLICKPNDARRQIADEGVLPQKDFE